MAKYADERVDGMRRQKDEELEQYKREVERQKRFEQKGAAQQEVPKMRVRSKAR